MLSLRYKFFLSISDGCNSSSDYSELFSLPPTSLNGGDAGYLNQAATELTAAMEREKEGEFSSAIRGYRTAVDILITGVQGEGLRRRIGWWSRGAKVGGRRHVVNCSVQQ